MFDTPALTLQDLPQSLGTFKPVGHVVVALPDADAIEQAIQALQEAGFSQDKILYLSADQGHDRMREMIGHSSELAGFGYEITLMRRYQKLSAQGHHWLLIHAPNDDQTAQVAEVAERLGAPMAVKYHRLAVEDLI